VEEEDIPVLGRRILESCQSKQSNKRRQEGLCEVGFSVQVKGGGKPWLWHKISGENRRKNWWLVQLVVGVDKKFK
jgi:hypothetical protein